MLHRASAHLPVSAPADGKAGRFNRALAGGFLGFGLCVGVEPGLLAPT